MKRIILIFVISLLSTSMFAVEFGTVFMHGARQQGMNEAFVGLADDGESVYYNQAGLVNLAGIEFMTMYARQAAHMTQGSDDFGINASNLGYAQNLGDKFGAFGVRWFYRGASQGDIYSSSENNILIGYGRTIKDIFGISKNNIFFQQLSAGFGLKLTNWKIDGGNGYIEGDSWDVGVDFSMYYRLLNRFSFGLTFKDAIFVRTDELDSYEKSFDYKFGGAWKYNPSNFDDVIAVDISQETEDYLLNIGTEKYFNLTDNPRGDKIIARGGTQIGLDFTENEEFYSFGIGFGYLMTDLKKKFDISFPFNMRFDYAVKLNSGAIEEAPINHTVQLTFLASSKPENKKPIAYADSYEIIENKKLTALENGVLINDFDKEEKPLTSILKRTTLNGTLVFMKDGTFAYTPNKDWNGVDTFTYFANDGNSSSKKPAKVTITIIPENKKPVAISDDYTIGEGVTLVVENAENILENDTDKENAELTAILDTDVSNGTLALKKDGSFEYTSNENWFGIDSFTYFANDGELSSEKSATVTIQVLEKPKPKKDDVILMENIYFRTDSDELLDASFPALKKAKAMFVRYPKIVIKVEGHTDSDGTASYNIGLSKRRAAAVVDYLVNNASVPASQLSSAGYGEEQPIATNKTKEGKAQNRRIEFKVISNEE